MILSPIRRHARALPVERCFAALPRPRHDAVAVMMITPAYATLIDATPPDMMSLRR